MKVRMLASGFFAGIATCAVMGVYLAPSAGDETAPKQESDMHQLWMQYGTPGKQHALLEKFAGEWDVTLKTWWDGTDKEPEVNKATVHAELIFGGRFLKTEMDGTMKIEMQGEKLELPIKGLGLMGYDSFKKKYVSTWIDSNNTAMWTSEGTSDRAGTTITSFGFSDDWMTGERGKLVKWIERVVDENTIASEMHDLALTDGPTKVFEMVWKRTSAKQAKK